MKFTFDTEYQREILKYVVQDPEGNIALLRINQSYFSLVEQAMVAESILKFYKKNKRIPSYVVSKEGLRTILSNNRYRDLVTPDIEKESYKILEYVYKTPLKDRDVLKESLFKFIAYIEMRQLNENFDLTDFSQYQEYSSKVSQILQRAKPEKKDEPIFLVRDVVERQYRRQADSDVIPSPFKQLNATTNAGGYPRGSIIVILDKPKRRKTFTLVNTARGYLRMGKNVLYIDLENGKYQIMDRIVQSTLSRSKRDLISGDIDCIEKNHMRKYKRLGVELIVQKLPAMVSNANTILELIQKINTEHGIHIDVLMIDYGGKLGSINEDKDDYERIKNAYTDLENLGAELQLDCIWTAQHVTRKAGEHKETRYEDNDIAGCIDIIRNATAIWGLNSSDEEDDNNIQRMELVVQRDGVPYGRALFTIDVEKQRMMEFTKEQIELYNSKFGDPTEDRKPTKRGTGNRETRDSDDIASKKQRGDI